MTPSDADEVDDALREKVSKSEWEEPVDKTVNWRFEQLVIAGYDFALAEELANNRRIDLHRAIDLADEVGAEAAYLRFF